MTRNCDMPVYRKVLGAKFDRMPTPLQELHGFANAAVRYEGLAEVRRGTGMLSRLAARIFRFPEVGDNVPLSVDFTCREGKEVWRRNFNGRCFQSVQRAGTGRFHGKVLEYFGPLCFAFILNLEDGKLHLKTVGWYCFGLPLPLALAPKGEAFEYGDGDRFNFHVEIGMPLTGLIVHYRGWLALQNQEI